MGCDGFIFGGCGGTCDPAPAWSILRAGKWLGEFFRRRGTDCAGAAVCGEARRDARQEADETNGGGRELNCAWRGLRGQARLRCDL